MSGPPPRPCRADRIGMERGILGPPQTREGRILTGSEHQKKDHLPLKKRFRKSFIPTVMKLAGGRGQGT